MKESKYSFEYLMQVIFIYIQYCYMSFIFKQDDRNHEKQSLKNKDQSKIESQNLCLKDNT